MRSLRRLLSTASLLMMTAAPLLCQTGMLFGDDHAFTLTAPEGWVLDNKSGMNQGLHMVFYPQGGTLQNSPVFAYGRSAALEAGIGTIEDLVTSIIRQFKADGSVNITARKEKTLPLTEGKTAEVYFYRGDRWGNYEAAGYILERKTINFLVFSGRGEKAFIDNIGKFYEILSSYKNLYQEDSEDYGERRFRDLLEMAQEDKATPQGKAYEDLLTRSQAKELVRLFQECRTYEKEGFVPTDLDAIFVVAEDGTIDDSYVWPVTSFGVCFKGSIASLKMPRHGLKSFHWHVSLKISEAGKDEGLSAKEPDPPNTGASGLEVFRVDNLPSNPFSISGYFNPYDYWSRFKPGTSVAFKIVSEAGESKTISFKRFELKRETPEKILIQVRSSFDLDRSHLYGAGLGKDEVSEMVLLADTPSWEESDLFRGFLSLNFSASRLFLDADSTSAAKERIDIKGRPIDTRRFTLNFENPQAETVITIWYSAEIPGGIARYTRQIRAPGTSVHEEILVEDFKAAEKSEEESQRPAWMARAEIPASTYLGKKLRYFEHARVIEARILAFFNAVMRSASLPDLRARLEDMQQTWLPHLEALMEDARQWKNGFEGDRDSIRLQLPEAEMAKLEPFFDLATRYLQAASDITRDEHEFVIRLFSPEAKRDLISLLTQRREAMRRGTEAWEAARKAFVAARDKLKDIRIRLK